MNPFHILRARFVSESPGLDPEYSLETLDDKHFDSLRQYVRENLPTSPGEIIEVKNNYVAVHSRSHQFADRDILNLNDELYECVYLWSQGIEGFDIHTCDPYQQG